MTLPNFLVIGAGRAGTTSIYHYLRQHPQVYMSPIKETNFFAYICADWDDRELERIGWSSKYPVRSLDAYQTLFGQVRGERAVGEVSPHYLANPRTAGCIRRYLPSVRLVAILRHPVDRAYSSFLFHTRDGRERRTFERAIEEELAGVRREMLGYGQLHYLRLGRYHELLQPYYELFAREQIAIFLFSELQRDPAAFMKEVFQLLEVDEEFVPDVSRRHNVSGIPKSFLVRLLLRDRPAVSRVKRRLPGRVQDGLNGLLQNLRGRGLDRPEMRAETRSWLADYYQADIERLEKLIGRDLSAWRT